MKPITLLLPSLIFISVQSFALPAPELFKVSVFTAVEKCVTSTSSAGAVSVSCNATSASVEEVSVELSNCRTGNGGVVCGGNWSKEITVDSFSFRFFIISNKTTTDSGSVRYNVSATSFHSGNGDMSSALLSLANQQLTDSMVLSGHPFQSDANTIYTPVISIAPSRAKLTENLDEKLQQMFNIR